MFAKIFCIYLCTIVLVTIYTTMGIAADNSRTTVKMHPDESYSFLYASKNQIELFHIGGDTIVMYKNGERVYVGNGSATFVDEITGATTNFISAGSEDTLPGDIVTLDAYVANQYSLKQGLLGSLNKFLIQLNSASKGQPSCDQNGRPNVSSPFPGKVDAPAAWRELDKTTKKKNGGH